MPAVGDAPALETMLDEQAAQYRLDARAELAVAAQEGLSGGIGDAGTSFGPWQLHYGGAYPASAPHSSPEASNRWAWSSSGVEYAERAMSRVAGGKRGDAAIEAIVSGFERPADPTGEIQAAEAWYHGNGQLPPGAGVPPPTTGSSGGQPVSFTGAPIGTTEAMLVRLAFAAAGVALLIVGVLLLSRAVSRRTVLAGAGGFLAGEKAGKRSSSSSSTSSSTQAREDRERGRAVREQAAREDAGLPPALRRRDPGPVERGRRGR